MARGSKQHVLEHGESREALRQLESPDHAALRGLEGRDARKVLAVERPGSGVGLVEARQKVEQRGLTGTIGADERCDRVTGHLEVRDIHCFETAELAGDAVCDDDRILLRNPGCGVTDDEIGCCELRH